MRAKDLHKYKTLDITELSGSPWNNAEKVLGLDENDKVVMAEPEELVTPEYVDNAIDQAMEAETARTESTYLKEHQSLDDYATKQYVDDAISEIDLSDYYTKEEVDEAIENVDVSDQLVNYALISSVTEDINTAIANETARTENTYAKPSDIPSLDGYAKTTAVTQDIQTAIASETARTEDVYAKKSEIPDLDNYYTKSETDEAIEEAISGISLEGYWTSAQTKNYVDAEITGATASETARTESTYAKKSEIPSLDGYATEQYVDDAIAAIPPVDLSAYARTTAVTQDIQTAIANETARTEETYAKIGDVPEVDLNPVFPRMPWFTLDNGGQVLDYVKSAIFDTYIPDGAEELVNCSEIWLYDTAFDYLDNNVPDDWGEFGPRFTIDPAEKVAYVENIPAGNYIFGLYKIQAGVNYDPEFEINYWSKDSNGWEPYTVEDSTSEIWDNSDFVIDQYWKDSFEGYVALTNNGELFNWSFPKDVERFEIRIVNNGQVDESLEINITYKEYATEEWVEDQGYLTEHQDLSDYAKTTAVTQAIQTAIAAETARTESTYLKEHQDISGKLDVSTFNTYTGATETVLEGKADVADIPDVSGFVTSGDVETQIGTAMSSETARTESVYAKKSEIPDLTNYYTKAQTNSAITAATEGLASEQWVEDKVDGHYDQEELEIGQGDQNWYSLTFDNTSQMFMTTNVTGIDISDVSQTFQPNVAYSLLGMDNPYTYSRLIVDLENDFVLTPGNINTEFTFIDPGEDWDWKNGVILRPENFPDGYPAYFIINKAAYTGRFSFTPTIQGDWVSGKLDETVFSTYTGATATAIAAKQDTLVSGTNIKTINNQSLLGSGNIDIQGGGGGGSVVELTKAQYEALNPPAADTTYIITDAETVDLNDYAMASGLTALETATTASLATKADKVNTTARSAPYLPSWNAQGIITGSSIHYEGAFNMNGTVLGSVIKTGNSVGATWYAPTSKGTAGQVLQSPSSGNEPTWSTYKFAFITQTQYDALSTKDATTIYFITGE